jgi:hypothetical protein
MRLGDVITMFLTPAGTVLRTRAQILADHSFKSTTPGQHSRGSRGIAWRVNPAPRRRPARRIAVRDAIRTRKATLDQCQLPRSDAHGI